MDVRRWIAGRLIRLAHKIYPPKVTVVNCIECGQSADEAARIAGLEIGRRLNEQIMQRASNFS